MTEGGGWDGAPRRGRLEARAEWHRQRGEWRGPRHVAGFIGCAVIGFVLFVALVTVAASWVAATILGLVSPGTGASVPAALAVVVVLVAAVVVVGAFVGRAVRPLASVAAATERLADGEPGVRVEVAGPGAVRRLAASFNAMADRIDRSRADRQALLADVTHELRTPLQVIAGNTEAMLDGVHPRDDAHLEPILAETRVMDRLLDDLRTLSLAEAGALPLHREEVDVRRLLSDVAASHAAAAGEAGVRLVADPSVGRAVDPVPAPASDVAGAGAADARAAPASDMGESGDAAALLLDADPVRVREIVGNLVTNALRHTPRGGSIRLAARREGDWIEIVVSDTGEGIDPADLGRVFDRFERRVDSGGSGLGLTIARDLVVAHGGTITAESDGIPGHGTTFLVRLPRPA